ncbi:MAG TPA: hypothetical protein VNQ99_17745 [Xanthobacteraceae bacterium]|nr:hypothetical protein [Xanthobacteraceae bacterium]
MTGGVFAPKDADRTVTLSEGVMRLVKEYARAHGIDESTAANELLREMLECR